MPVEVGINPEFGPEEVRENPVMHIFWGRDGQTYTISGKTHADVAIQASIAGLTQKEATTDVMRERLTPEGDLMVLVSDVRRVVLGEKIRLNYRGGPLRCIRLVPDDEEKDDESYMIPKKDLAGIERVAVYEAGGEVLGKLKGMDGIPLILGGGLLIVIPKGEDI